jgi:hypothetical protein
MEVREEKNQHVRAKRPKMERKEDAGEKREADLDLVLLLETGYPGQVVPHRVTHPLLHCLEFFLGKRVWQPLPAKGHEVSSTSQCTPIGNQQSAITNHQLPITNHQSPITNHQPKITNNRQSPNMCDILPHVHLFLACASLPFLHATKYWAKNRSRNHKWGARTCSRFPRRQIEQSPWCHLREPEYFPCKSLDSTRLEIQSPPACAKLSDLSQALGLRRISCTRERKNR